MDLKKIPTLADCVRFYWEVDLSCGRQAHDH